MKIDDVEQLKILAFGAQGVVYAAGPKYVLKKQLISARDAAMATPMSSGVVREIIFCEKIANRFPDSFAQLFDWRV
jgi:hypothetical protein